MDINGKIKRISGGQVIGSRIQAIVTLLTKGRNKMTSINGRDLYWDERCLRQPNAQRVVRLLHEMQRTSHIDRRLDNVSPQTERRATGLLAGLRHVFAKQSPA